MRIKRCNPRKCTGNTLPIKWVFIIIIFHAYYLCRSTLQHHPHPLTPTRITKNILKLGETPKAILKMNSSPTTSSPQHQQQKMNKSPTIPPHPNNHHQYQYRVINPYTSQHQIPRGALGIGLICVAGISLWRFKYNGCLLRYGHDDHDSPQMLEFNQLGSISMVRAPEENEKKRYRVGGCHKEIQVVNNRPPSSSSSPSPSAQSSISSNIILNRDGILPTRRDEERE